MGGCFSLDGDVRGGMEAVGGGVTAASAQQGGLNDAVDYFFQTRGLRGLYTPIEVNKRAICWIAVWVWWIAVLGSGGIGILLLCLIGGVRLLLVSKLILGFGIRVLSQTVVSWFQKSRNLLLSCFAFRCLGFVNVSPFRFFGAHFGRLAHSDSLATRFVCLHFVLTLF